MRGRKQVQDGYGAPGGEVCGGGGGVSLGTLLRNGQAGSLSALTVSAALRCAAVGFKGRNRAYALWQAAAPTLACYMNAAKDVEHTACHALSLS